MDLLLIAFLSFGIAILARFLDLSRFYPTSVSGGHSFTFPGDLHSDIFGAIVGTLVLAAGVYSFYPHLNYAGKFLGLFMFLYFILFLIDSRHRKVEIIDGQQVVLKSLFAGTRSFDISEIINVEQSRLGLRVILAHGRQYRILGLTEDYPRLVQFLKQRQANTN